MQSCALKPSATSRRVWVAAPVKSTSEVSISPRDLVKSSSGDVAVRWPIAASAALDTGVSKTPSAFALTAAPATRPALVASPTIHLGGPSGEVEPTSLATAGGTKRPSSSTASSSEVISTSSTPAVLAASARSAIRRQDGSSIPNRFGATTPHHNVFPRSGARCAYSLSRSTSAAMPGSSRPCTNSSDAPPPVDTCETLSASPA